MTRTVLVTGARAAAALDIARDFTAAGYRTFCADSASARISRWSRRTGTFLSYPAPRADAAAFGKRICGLVDELSVDLIVPTCEEAFHLAAPALAPRLAGKLFQPPLATLRNLHDKYRFARLAAGFGLPVPETHLLESEADVARLADRSAGWVFKPCFSRFGEAALVGPAAGELRRVEPSSGRGWVAQRRVPGGEACFYAVARDGELRAFAAYRSDWRLGGGASFGFEPLDAAKAAALRDIAAALAGRLSLTGQFACDAIFDANGQPWLIECNPRATSGVHFLAGEGRLAAAIDGGGEGCLDGDGRPRHLLPAMLSFGLGVALRRGDLGGWIAALREGRDVIGQPGDRLPAFGAFADGLGFTFKGMLRGTSASAMTVADIAWDGEDLP
ncbi:ATP-grasp domain-containing protein [Sphingopyxis sp. J-6]|uniref:ATP-grasp domain-containing protein n=1 Tax=Sphingopyxis sp. J-6 TaxID=3122054 RepID=UPI003983F737